MSSSIVYNNLLSKNYLNLSYTQLNSPKQIRRLLSVLAIANFNFRKNKFKKIENKNNYSFLDTLIMPDSVSIIHSNFSPFDIFMKSLAKAGIVVVKEPATACIFVSYLICIPPIYAILYINTYIYLFTNIYNYLNSLIYRNLYIYLSS